VQKTFIDHGAMQCGFCTPGIVMTVKALLDEIPRPSDEEIKDALSETFCRCTGHLKIMEAVKKASDPVEKGVIDGPKN
jgi:carbon-monoxide dehydrogenase small subunit